MENPFTEQPNSIPYTGSASLPAPISFADAISTVEAPTPEIPPVRESEQAIHEQPLVRVRVYRSEGGTVVIDTGDLELPSVNSVISYLPTSEYRKLAKQIYASRLQFAVSSTLVTIPLQIWADAIGAAIIHRIHAIKDGEFLSKELDQNAFMAVGGTVYKLTPVSISRSNGALAAVRKSVQERIKLEAADILARAQIRADEIHTQARVSADSLMQAAITARTDAQRELARLSSATAPPTWAMDSGLVLRFTNSTWQFRMTVPITITGYEVYFTPTGSDEKLLYHWDASAITVSCDMWVLLDASTGKYQFEQLHLDKASPLLPHMSYTGACLKPGDAPRTINSIDAAKQLKSAIQRTFRIVQLDSLFVGSADWIPTFGDGMPADLRIALGQCSSSSWGGAEYLARTSYEASKDSVITEGNNTTWKVIPPAA